MAAQPRLDPVRSSPRASAAQRQASLRVRSEIQRGQVAVSWRRLEPTLSSADDALARFGTARARLIGWCRHPLALPLATLSLGGLVASGNTRRLLGALGTATRLAGGAVRLAGSAAAFAPLWIVVKRALSGAASPRAEAGARSGARGAPSPWKAGKPDRPS